MPSCPCAVCHQAYKYLLPSPAWSDVICSHIKVKVFVVNQSAIGSLGLKAGLKCLFYTLVLVPNSTRSAGRTSRLGLLLFEAHYLTDACFCVLIYKAIGAPI